MNFLHALILGIVEGLTEFLPVSSTGHLIVAGKVLNLPDSNFTKSFDIIIQLGAILSVVVLYWRKLLLSLKTLLRIGVAFVPTAILGFTAYPYIKKYLLGNVSVVLWSLAIGGAAIIVFEQFYARKKLHIADAKAHIDEAQPISSLPFKDSFLIGLFQTLAFIPGVSRSGATIIGGMLLGISRATIVEFSFLLAVPTMAAATGLDLIKNAHAFAGSDWGVLSVGLVTSFVVAGASILFFMKFIKKHTFSGFGVYRILAAAAFALYFFA